MDARTRHPALQGLLRPLERRAAGAADGSTAAGKVRFVDYSDEFLLPGFGRRGRIPGRRASGDLLEDLSAAVLKQTARQQTALEAALRAQKWFEGVKSKFVIFSQSLRMYPPRPQDRNTRRRMQRRSRGRPHRSRWKHFMFSHSRRREKAPRVMRSRRPRF